MNFAHTFNDSHIWVCSCKRAAQFTFITELLWVEKAEWWNELAWKAVNKFHLIMKFSSINRNESFMVKFTRQKSSNNQCYYWLDISDWNIWSKLLFILSEVSAPVIAMQHIVWCVTEWDSWRHLLPSQGTSPKEDIPSLQWCLRRRLQWDAHKRGESSESPMKQLQGPLATLNCEPNITMDVQRFVDSRSSRINSTICLRRTCRKDWITATPTNVSSDSSPCCRYKSLRLDFHEGNG